MNKRSPKRSTRRPRRRASEKRAPGAAPKTHPPIWSGMLSFGLVAIPVRVTAAVRDPGPHFHWLHDRDYARLRTVYRCSRDRHAVRSEDIVHGVEVRPGRWVTLSEQELASLEPDRTRILEIESFVDAETLPTTLIDRPYYLVPGGAEKPYRLLERALAATRRAGLTRFVMHQKDHWAAILSLQGTLCLLTLRFPNEVEPAGPTVEGGDRRVFAEEKKIRRALDRLAGSFSPSLLANPDLRRRRNWLSQQLRTRPVVEAPDTGDEPQDPEALIAALEAGLAEASRPRHRRRKLA